MPIKMIVDTLDDVPEALRGEYEEHDGKFRLSLEGAEDTTGLKRALQSEREARKALEKQSRQWSSVGKTPEEIAELVAAAEKAAEDAARKSGDVESVLNQHRAKWEADRKALAAQLEAAQAAERQAVVGNGLVQALSKAGATASGIDLLPRILQNRIEYQTQDGNRVLRINDGDGRPMAGSGTDGTATLEDLAREAVTQYPELFAASGNSGTGRATGGAGGAGPRKRSEMSEADKAAYVRKHGQAAYLKLPT